MFFIIVIRSFYIFLFKLRKTILLIHVSGTCSQIWHDIILKENTYNLNKRRNYVLIALYMIICSPLFKVKSQSILLLFFFLKKKIKCLYKHDHTQLLLLHTKKSKEKWASASYWFSFKVALSCWFLSLCRWLCNNLILFSQFVKRE